MEAALSEFLASSYAETAVDAIAKRAGASRATYYRYFDSKSDIILAIVQQQLKFLRDELLLNRNIDLASDIAARFGTANTQYEHGMNAVLLLEISAEATRDPRVAAALDEFDTTLRARLVEWLARAPETGGQGLPTELAPSRALLLQCLVEGLKVRETREPNLDRELLMTALREFVGLVTRSP